MYTIFTRIRNRISKKTISNVRFEREELERNKGKKNILKINL